MYVGHSKKQLKECLSFLLKKHCEEIHLAFALFWVLRLSLSLPNAVQTGLFMSVRRVVCISSVSRGWLRVLLSEPVYHSDSFPEGLRQCWDQARGVALARLVRLKLCSATSLGYGAYCCMALGLPCAAAADEKNTREIRIYRHRLRRRCTLPTPDSESFCI